jgi:hypothetical protein
MTNGAARRGPGTRSKSIPTAARFVIAALAGGALCYLAGHELVALHSASWPILVLAFGLVLAACVAFSFASAQLEVFLRDRPNAAGAVHWFAIASLGLVFAAILGIPTAALGPRELTYVLAEDVGLALVLALILAAFGPAIGAAIHRGLKPFSSRRAADWAGPDDWPKRLGTLLLRCLAVAVIGLFLSVGEQTVGSVDEPLTGNTQNVYAPLGGWILGTAIAWRLTTPLFPIPSYHPSRHAVHGTALTLLFSILFIAVFAHGAADSAQAQLWSRTDAHNLAQPVAIHIPTQHARPDYQALASAFSPALRFQQGEHWFPTSVSWFAKTATPHRDLARCLHVCYTLACDDATGACAPNGLTDPTVYVRVASGGAWPDTEIPQALRGRWALVQYWFFYNYDSLGIPLLTQWHQGDWEQITIALSVKGQTATPRFVAYSEHCAGVILPWSRVEIGSGQTHPLVFVAKGSHANYPRPINAPIRQLGCSLGLTPPRYLGIGGLFFAKVVHGSDTEVPVAYVVKINDHTGNQPQPAYTLQPLTPGDPIETFHGSWGRDNRLNLLSVGAQITGDAPRSPPDQSTWTAPGRNMLCSDRWASPPPGEGCEVFLPPASKG